MLRVKQDALNNSIHLSFAFCKTDKLPLTAPRPGTAQSRAPHHDSHLVGNAEVRPGTHTGKMNSAVLLLLKISTCSFSSQCSSVIGAAQGSQRAGRLPFWGTEGAKSTKSHHHTWEVDLTPPELYEYSSLDVTCTVIFFIVVVYFKV